MTSVEPEGERVVARLRPHGRALFWPAVVFLAAVFGMAYFAGRFVEPWENIAVPAFGLLLIVLLSLLPLLFWLGKRYIVTTRRIIIRTGFFVRIRQELLHSRGYDVSVRKSPLQSMFRSGDILINANLDHPVRLKDVPGADLVQGALHDLMEKSLNPIAARRQAEETRESDVTTVWGTR
jgi:membrane protein YdbS with pleckstrin-like domain